jgi:hypothetical protein
LPWGFVDSMTAPTLTSLTKEMIAYFAQIAESNVSRILLHLSKYLIYFSHINYSIIIGIIVNSCFRGFLYFPPHGVVDCGAFYEVTFVCISPKNLIGDFFYSLNVADNRLDRSGRSPLVEIPRSSAGWAALSSFVRICCGVGTHRFQPAAGYGSRSVVAISERAGSLPKRCSTLTSRLTSRASTGNFCGCILTST